MKLLSIATRDFVDFVNRKTVYANQSARSFIKNRTGNSTKCCGFIITLPLQNQAKNGLTFLYACGKIYTVVVSLQWEGGIKDGTRDNDYAYHSDSNNRNTRG